MEGLIEWMGNGSVWGDFWGGKCRRLCIVDRDVLKVEGSGSGVGCKVM